MKRRVVIALGGNALQKNGEATAEAQKKVAESVADTIVKLSRNYEIIIAHGNGPQVGNILIHEESAATDKAPAMPLETAVAMSQGQIGYWLSQAITNAFSEAHRRVKVSTVVTQVLVDRSDPAFKNPTKPIGTFYTEKEAKALAREKGWTVKEDAGRGWRRVVPSPRPLDIIERKSILDLVKTGNIVIAVGGGGIPVVRTKIMKKLKGVDAVVDKDYAAACLAELLAADIFVSVTAVPCVYINYGLPDARPIGHISSYELSRLIRYNYFAAGSMLPKVEACVTFARRGGTGIITDIKNLPAALAGRSDTIVTK